jgi:V/A-type H+-transporting ATPase subunit I
MIERMKKIYIYSLKNHSTEIMEEVLKCGAIQLTRAESMLPDGMDEMLRPAEKVDLSGEEILLKRIWDCLEIIRPYDKKKSIFQKREEHTYEALTEDALLVEASEICSEIEKIKEEEERIAKELRETEFRESSLTPWVDFDLSIDRMETQDALVACYVLQEPRTLDDVLEMAEEKGLAIHGEEVLSEKSNRYIAVLFHKKDQRRVREAIGELGAKSFSFEGLKGSFQDNIALCKERKARLGEEMKAREAALEEVAARADRIKMASDALEVRMQALGNRDGFLGTNRVDIITGWIPASRQEDVDRRLSSLMCSREYRDPEGDEDYPVLMKNSKIVEPFGTITEMYSLPNPYSVDTNWAIGLFFFIFFGMMLSDMGYGLILLVGGLLGAKHLDVGEGTKKMMRMLGLCGISTMIWGLIYGSFFGNAAETILKTFFGIKFTFPTLVDPLNQPMTVLILACSLGVVHVFVGMGIKAYIMIRKGNLLGAVFDVGLWYVFLIGLPLIFLAQPISLVGKVMAIVGGVGLVLTQGRHKPTFVGKATSGILSLYDLTGYFSDVLSYSRVLALGLSTSVVGSVVNIMASMPGSGILSVLAFILIFIAGHMLNMGINALGAYVHSARLQYVEFFGKYYEGGGTKFVPFQIKTKFIRITEEK